MKKLFLILMMAVTMVGAAQISRPQGSSKVGEFSKLVNLWQSGQRVDKVRVQTLYKEINCMLIDVQAEALNIGLVDTREETCGSSEFPRTQAIPDDSFKKYAADVQTYLKLNNK